MRYILDDLGYIEEVSFGAEIICNDKSCIEYTGEVPDGYESLLEWSINANIRAYKIVDGNLVYDANRCAELEAQFEKETEENATATHKWVRDKLRVSNSVVTDELSSSATGTSLIVLNDAGNYEIPELKVESVSAASVNVISSNKNILGIEALSASVNGVDIIVNADGTITLNGTATDNIEFDLSGSDTNEEMLFLMKNDINYTISGLTDNVSLSLYSYDGTERTLVSESSNGVISSSNSYLITQTTLKIASGITLDNVVISPQIEIGIATDFVKHEETNANGVLVNNECFIDGLMSYSDKTIIMIDKEVISSVKYYRYQYLNHKFAEIEVNENEVKSTVSEMNETIGQQNVAISQISQTVNEIKSEISDIADITTSNEGYGSISLENINESEPIYLKLYPSNNEDISYLYASESLYPSNDLFLKRRILRFQSGDYHIDYELPNDLLYYDENNYDEFILDYDTQKCEVNKRVGFNTDGSKYILDKPETISYEYPSIPLEKGDYTVTMLGYNYAYIFARLMCENIYTNQFATKVELNSEIIQTKESIKSEVKEEYATKGELNTSVSTIKQTTDSINLEVAKKVDNKDYTSAQILLKINNDTSSTVIKSDKLDVDAIATFTNNKLAKAGSTTINGSNITTGTISASRLDTSKINATKGDIAGFVIDGSSGLAGDYGTIRPNGNLLLYPEKGSSRYVLSKAMTFNAQGGVVVASNSNANITAPSTNLDLKACSGAVAYLGCMGTSAGTDERSGVSCADGVLNLRSNGVIYANGAAIGGSSSKNTKTNIVELSQEKKDELYSLVKDVPLYEYDYKPEYGKEVNYGFLIEDVEGTKLNDLLHIVKVNENIKTYCSEDLTRLNLIVIKELMNKVEMLENRIKELESEK